MQRRVISVWLPRLATDRLSRATPAWRDVPLVTVAPGASRRVAGLNRVAQKLGLRPAMPLADALALVPDLIRCPHDQDADARLLTVLAERVGMFSPWSATAGPDGLWLDVAGCGHLFGGETQLLHQLSTKLKAQGFSARAALAPTPGAAWAWVRFGDPTRPILDDLDQLAALPLAALRLDAPLVAQLSALGLRRIGDIAALPRAQISLRFGRQLLWRLDQAFGDEPEPLSPLRPVAPHRVHIAFVEPISRPLDISASLDHLLERLCAHLAAEALGARNLELSLFRVDGSLDRCAIGTSAPSHDPVHLARLFREPLAGLRPDFGYEAARLDCPFSQNQPPHQARLDHAADPAADLGRLLDTLGNRLGPHRLMRLLPHPSHIPERMVRRAPVNVGTINSDWPAGRYPLHLLDHPEPIEAMAPIPDAPPVRFRWQGRLHQVVRADGPERIAPEWWHEDGADRDYYRIEDSDGLRLWLYRLGHYGAAEPPRWYLHGIFP